MKLIQLEQVLKKVDRLQSLAPPATESCLSQAEDSVARPLPTQLRELYLWRNGQPEIGTTLQQNWRFMPLAELVEAYRVLLYSTRDWSADWLPFAANGGGDHLLVDGQGRVLEYWHADEDRPVISDSLADWIDHVIGELGRPQCPPSCDAWDRVDLYLEKPPEGGNQALLKLRKELKLPIGISQLAQLCKNVPVPLAKGIYFFQAEKHCRAMACLGVRKDGKVVLL